MPAAVAVAAVAASAYAANRQSSAARKAAQTQADAAQAGIDEQRRQFDATQELLKPWVTTGTTALGGQKDLVGLNGNDAQSAAIQALQSSPQFTSLLQRGENSILANASATGGLRGGNTQGALAQFSPALLAATINDQYNKLGGLSEMGLNAAGQTGQFGQAASNNISSLLQQQGAAVAGGQIAYGKGQAGYANAISNGIGMYYGMTSGGGGLGGLMGGNSGQQSTPYYTPINTYSPYSLNGMNARFGGGF